MTTRESTLVLWFQSLTHLPLRIDVKSWTDRNNNTYWTDNPSICHICICIHGKNFEIFYNVDVASSIYLFFVRRWSVLMKGQFLWNILVTFVCQKNVEISIWHKFIWKLYQPKIINGGKDGTQTTFPIAWQEWCALELPSRYSVFTNLCPNLPEAPSYLTLPYMRFLLLELLIQTEMVG